jgi:hypothetical protein
MSSCSRRTVTTRTILASRPPAGTVVG